MLSVRSKGQASGEAVLHIGLPPYRRRTTPATAAQERGGGCGGSGQIDYRGRDDLTRGCIITTRLAESRKEVKGTDFRYLRSS
jgi:hypothetical protein